ncbi:MAG: hypothetical protein JWP12_1385 [Bacteroidetes bacterium]|nr:hypothetical protein [Bacteroidota bacterium]
MTVGKFIPSHSYFIGESFNQRVIARAFRPKQSHSGFIRWCEIASGEKPSQ